MAYETPPEQDVQKVMQDTGMDRLQAYRHVQQSMYLRSIKTPYPLGKAASLDM